MWRRANVGATVTRMRPFGAVWLRPIREVAFFKVVENAQRRVVKFAACLSQCDGTRGAVNEFGAEFIFKGGDLFAHSRLTNSTFLCDSGEAPFFNYSDEHLHCIEFVHSILYSPLWKGFQARSLYAFLLGIAGIPQSTKSACSNHTSDRGSESSEQENSQLHRRSGECSQRIIGGHMSKLSEKVAAVAKPTHQTAPTQFVEANGIRFAYRRFGNAARVPLVFMQHFRGGMDHWDPKVTDGFAEHRPVILFDNAGVAASTGETPDTIDA